MIYCCMKPVRANSTSYSVARKFYEGQVVDENLAVHELKRQVDASLL
jgi:hypothetical protein